MSFIVWTKGRDSAVKLFIHEYSGHAFGIELSRELARQGHEVIYTYSAAIESPRGPVQPRRTDPSQLTILPIGQPGSLDKYSFVHRIFAERRYGRSLAAAIIAAAPDVVFLSTTPNDVLDMVRRLVPATLPLVWWLQDIYSLGIRSVLTRWSPFAAKLAAHLYREKERRFAARAQHVISITGDFRSHLVGLGVPPDKITVIENWGSLEEIRPMPQENEWSRAHDLAGKKIVLYAGTLGLKHNPIILLDAASHFQQRQRADVQIVVATEGLGATFLRREAQARGLGNMTLLSWQAHAQLPAMLASASILVAIIEPQAADYSVPSKVLSFLCAGRPVVAALPATNLAARIIVEAGAGFVVPPGDSAAFIRRIEQVLDDPQLQVALGGGGRTYAERHFDIHRSAGGILKIAQAAILETTFV